MGNRKKVKEIGRKSDMRRLPAILLATLLALFVLPAGAGEQIYAAAQTGQVSVSGTKYYDYAYEVLTLVNEQRAKAGRSALSPDAHLTEVAMLRAAECSVRFSHTRPNGKSCFTADAVWSSASAYGENIAYGYNSSASVMNGWVNSQGHYANIINGSYRSVGIGAVKVGNTLYWEQAFSSNTSASAPQRGTGSATFSVETQAGSSGSTPAVNTGGSTQTPGTNTESGTQTVPGTTIALPTVITGGCTGNGSNACSGASSVNDLLKNLTQSLNCGTALPTNGSTDSNNTCGTNGSADSKIGCGTIEGVIPGSFCAADGTCLVGSADCSGADSVSGNGCTDAACAADSCLLAIVSQTQSCKGSDAMTAADRKAEKTDGADASAENCAVPTDFAGVEAVKAQATKTMGRKPSKVKSVRISAQKGALKIHCKKVKQADGYQVQTAVKKSFCKSSIRQSLSTKKTSCTVSGPGKGQKCYVRVRSYCKSNGKTCYSAWSKVKTATTKK